MKKYQIVCKCIAIAVTCCSVLSSARGDVILNSITGFVSARIQPAAAVTGTTTSTIGSVTRTFNGTDNNFTTSSEDQAWNNLTQTLTGNGLVTEAKTLAAKPGGLHNGISRLTLVFTTTTATNLSLSGVWGFVGNTAGVADSISWTLTGPSTSVSQSASTTGGNNQAFSNSVNLGVGTFTFVIEANLNETINNVATRTAEWHLASFDLNSLVSVPEPGSIAAAAAVVAIGLVASPRRKLTGKCANIG
jgi:hypothetical protein